MAKILMVDDEPDALKVMQYTLKRSNHQLVTAKDGMEAMAMLESEQDVDLILLDRRMPKMDGLEVLRRVKAPGSPHRHIPVVIQSAAIQEADTLEGLEAGAVQYLCKPYSIEKLRITVQTILQDVEAIREQMNSKLDSAIAELKNSLNQLE